jgi:type IV pilus assembly protein PilE
MHSTRSKAKRPLGFTLIELMIVVAVIAILAIIALPQYVEHVRKGKRSEALEAIGDMQLREERWRAEHPAYGVTDDLTGSASNTTALNNARKYYNVSATTVAATAGTSYVITATRKGDLANDPRCGNFILTQAIVPPATTPSVVKTVSSGDAAYCWRQ